MAAEERQEYRVAWRFPDRSGDSYSTVTPDRDLAERTAQRIKSNARVQVRTVTVSDWSELAEAGEMSTTDGLGA